MNVAKDSKCRFEDSIDTHFLACDYRDRGFSTDEPGGSRNDINTEDRTFP